MKTFSQYLSESRLTHKQLKKFEEYVDRMFEKYDIDIDFTRHFTDRFNDERNKPRLTTRDLSSFIMKIYKAKGTRLKKKKDFEAVLKDIVSDVNMPVAIEYDNKNDEIKVIAKTVMRKKDFKTPDPIIKY